MIQEEQTNTILPEVEAAIEEWLATTYDKVVKQEDLPF